MAEVRFLAPSIFCACKLPVISWVFFFCVGVTKTMSWVGYRFHHMHPIEPQHKD